MTTCPDRTFVAERLDTALDVLLHLRLRLLGLPDAETPLAALDEALACPQATAYRDARRAFRKAFASLLDLHADDRSRLLRLEATVNALACEAAAIGWRLGVRQSLDAARGAPTT